MIRKAHWEGGSTQGAKKSTRPPREPSWALYKAKLSTGPHLATRGCVCLQDGLKRIGWDNWMASMTFESPHFKQL